MRVAIGIVSLFPGGGLQRDCLEIARLLNSRGHDVTIFAARVTEKPWVEDVSIVVLPNRQFTNHQIQAAFAADFSSAVAGKFDLVVGFDKLLGLDVLYCADASMRYRLSREFYLHAIPRYRTFSRLEGDAFAPEQSTKIFVLSQNQFTEYVSAWSTEPERVVLLPPTLAADRRKPELRLNGVRQSLRAKFGFDDSHWVWIAVCVQPNTKGLDRTLRALSEFPMARLLVVGLEPANGSVGGIGSVSRLAWRNGVSHQVQWLGHREDVPQLMAAADLLVHPARYDTTGTVILEAIVNGLPVVTTATCGYAIHVEAAEAGIVMQRPIRLPVLCCGSQRITGHRSFRTVGDRGARIRSQRKEQYVVATK